MKEIYKNALKSWHKLKHIVETFNGTLEELCDKLYGHNLEDDLFDVNFEMICGTITKEENKLKLTNYIHKIHVRSMPCDMIRNMSTGG